MGRVQGLMIAVIVALLALPAAAHAVVLQRGDILVADANAFGNPGGVILVNPTTGAQTTVSSGGSFNFPIGIAVAANRDIYVSDAQAFGGGGGVIRVNPATGAQTTVSSGGSFVDPGGIAIDNDGSILVADANAFGGGGGIIRVNPTTGAQTTVSSGGLFQQPSDLALEANGSIVVAENNNEQVIRVNPTTGAQTLVASSTGNLEGIAVEANGNILVTRPGFSVPDRVIRVNALTGAQSILSEANTFNQPNGLDVEADGNIVVADQDAFGGSGGVIRVNPTTGAQSTVASGGSFVDPFGIAVVRPAAPVAATDAYATDEDTALNVTAPGVLGNDSDLDGDPLTAALATGPAHGTVTFNANGSFRYTPAANYNGTDTFTYRASDGSLTSPPTQVTITVRAVNDAPAATADTYATDEDTTLDVPAGTGVLANDSDLDGDALSAVLATGPAHGTLTLNANGSLRYVPAANYNGPDSFTYRASDGALSSPVTTASITVRAVNDAPSAADHAYTTAEDTPLTVNVPGVLAGAADADGDALSAALVSGPGHGEVTLNRNGSFTYTPARDFNGADSFRYRAGDGTLDSTPATVSITVTAVNDAPSATADAYATDEDRPLAVDAPGVLANDTDLDGDALSAVLVSGPAHGDLTLKPDGSFSYIPARDYNGADAFTYRASDGTLESAPVTVALDVHPVDEVALPAAPPPAPVTGAGEATLSVQSAGLSVFVRSRSSMRCRVSTGRLRSCTVRLQAGKRVIATGSHRASGAGVVVRLRLTRSGKAMLARRLGGVRAQVRVSAVTDRGARQATASTRAVLQVEHFTTPAGSWNPAEATLTGKGTRFVKHLRGKLIAVAKLRCDGYDANVRPGPGSSAEMSLARAKTLCAALGLHVRPRLVGHADADPIASNATEPGRAANRRVEVTVTHAPRRLPR